MADQKISGLTAYTTPHKDDLFVIVDMVGTDITKKITVENALAGITIKGTLGLQTGNGTTGAVFNLSTTETTVVSGDILGQIDFQAPLEDTGTDAILVGASIWAKAEAEFTGGVNSTSLVFATGASETAAGKMWIKSDGKVSIGIETPDGTLHVHTASAGAIAAHEDADDLIIENSTGGGITISTPDSVGSRIYFASPSDNKGAAILWNYDANNFSVFTHNPSAVLQLASGSNAVAITIDGNQDVTIDAGSLAIPATEKLYFDGANNTYIYESGADVLDVYVGGVIAQKMTEATSITGVLYGAWSITDGLTIDATTTGIDIGVCTHSINFGTPSTAPFKFVSDDTIVSDANGSILNDISSETNAGFIKVITDGSTVRYIALYELKS